MIVGSFHAGKVQESIPFSLPLNILRLLFRYWEILMLGMAQTSFFFIEAHTSSLLDLAIRIIYFFFKGIKVNILLCKCLG